MDTQMIRLGALDTVLIQPQAPTEPRALVLLCHGFGAPGTDLVGLAQEWVRMDPALEQVAFAFPMAPIQLDPIYDSRAWWMIDLQKIERLMANGQAREMASESPPELPQRREELQAVLHELQTRLRLTPQQTILGGFSQGAMLTTDVALHQQQPIGGLLIWSGALINQDQWTAAAATAAPLKVVQSHGRQDPILPFTAGEQLSRVLVGAGHSVDFLPFDGPHTISAEALTAGAQLIRKLLSGAGSIETGGNKG